MRDNPFDEIETLLDRVSRQVEEGMAAGGLQVPGTVPVDVADTDEAYVVTADLPGYETDDIELTLSDGTLRLEANRLGDDIAAEGTYLRRERTKTSASRRIRLPEPVDEEAGAAGFENGVLTVRLPKVAGGEDSKRIDIE
ncbi:Hsp20/alpha crystallin family protein [Natrinema sp. J7-1]|uniref:Hsp20/alpha crystallin family protein n=1 Tax=Natrinema sp. J7-1 TaxID=1172566 RepID=UPI000677D2DE|nr:Hsp20/alpha crystallin family protein [Natrinema sp. J7-1]